MTQKTINLCGAQVGDGCAPFIVAELSANHNGNIDVALQSIEVAKEMGASAIKIQTYTPDTLTIDCNRPDFLIKGGLWDGDTLYDLYKKAYTPYGWHEKLFAKAHEVGIPIFSSPFDSTAVDLLESLHAPAYKIASFELVDLPLIARVAKTGKPMIMSTGMADLEEIGEAVKTAKDHGCQELIVLHCISGYPTPVDQANLRVMADLREQFDLLVGLSDHTLGTTVSVAAVALGACFIEKHFIIDRSVGGPDSSFSIEPDELKQLVQDANDVRSALGMIDYSRKAAEKDNLVFRRSIYVVEDIEAGDPLTEKNCRIIRPGYGLKPKHYYDVLEKKAARKLVRGEALAWDMLV